MKRLMGLFAAGVFIVALSGCGGGGGDDYYPPEPNLTTLFLVDEYGEPYVGIPYLCDSMYEWEYTKSNGEFTFSPPDNCEFDFYGYYGTDPYDFTVPYNEYIYIVDIADEGKNGIPYECASFNVGNINYTSDDGIWDGSFEYDADDACVFYL
ncbi:MAG: hypothetical protein U9O64_10355 [Campylobacterota bacterium]|nr:hypothetical protein [Campylobacterota bacterium]